MAGADEAQGPSLGVYRRSAFGARRSAFGTFSRGQQEPGSGQRTTRDRAAKARSRGQPLELHPRADLDLSWRVAGVVSGQQQVLRGRLVAGRIGEVGAVRQVEQ